jgi:lipoprotein-anchoring transpeptidase ErfK/SrfK
MRTRFVLVAAAALAAASAARAAVLTTSPLAVGFGGPATTLSCNVANLGSQPLAVLAEIVDGQGAVLGSETLALPAGGALRTEVPGPAFAYCRFSFAGGKGKVRASAQALDADSSPHALEIAR